jgi:proline iminopeptidase
MTAPLGQPRRTLYAENEPFSFGWLRTGGAHEVFYEESGSRAGRPCLILHGGPGGAINPTMRRFFDPSRWRMTLFDQRGCGRSRPNASLEDNTTWALIEDIERLRERLEIESWTVFGGSWGSTLALAYAATHPARVDALVLRGVFLLTQRELRWFYQEGASMLFPDAWERFLAPIPPAERDDLLSAYHRRLVHPDRAVPRRVRRSSTNMTSPSPSPASRATTSSTAASSLTTAGCWIGWTPTVTSRPGSSRAASTWSRRWIPPGA